jgi:electron-transferring-flavoprotein dehydrogenase
MEFDVVIVGAGPAGLACAIHLKQLDESVNVCVIEKGSEIGAHLLSGAAFEPRALNELIPDWKEKGAPLKTPATKDKFLFLTKTKAFRLPNPPQMHNKGNYIISLGEFAKWLGEQAESLGVEIFPGFAAAELLYDANGAVIGIATGDMSGEPGMELHARQLVLAEGCHGSLTKIAKAKYDLGKDCDPQTYGLGVKEIWEIKPENHKSGNVTHTIGWPMDTKTYGGSWLYHMDNNLVSIGFVVGLDYENPTLSPYQEMQRFKTHPAIKPILEGGRRISYGARALCEGGFQSIPKLTFPGGLLIGDSAGFLNVPKIKGNHTAMKSGMVAAQSIIETLKATEGFGVENTAYQPLIEQSWLWKELKTIRNLRPGFHKGLWIGLINAAIETITFGKLPHTLKNHADHLQTKPISEVTPIQYPKPDGIITFDRLTSVSFSNTNHAEGQPGHLKLIDPSLPTTVNLPKFGGPSQYYCPAGVYEFVDDGQGNPKFQINAQNCVHCKTCDIKDPEQNIIWTTPQGGDGPNYSGM